jgi:leucyl aminopeptidase
MPIPELQTTTTPAPDVQADVLVLGVQQLDGAPRLLAAGGFAPPIDLPSIGVTGAAGEFTRLPGDGIDAVSIGLIGLGSGDVTADGLRTAAGTVTRRVRGAEHIAFALPIESEADARAVLTGAALGAYLYTAFKSEQPKPAKSPVARVTLVTTGAVAEETIVRAAVEADVVRLVKDLVNMPPLDLFPEALADRALEAIGDLAIETTVWDEAQLAADGFGGILGVGQGSTRPPRLVKLVWSPQTATQHVALVGKGITFDSGGLSLKTPGGMIGMKDDMAGAATILGVVLAAARLDLPVRVTAWMCIAENMPSGSAIRPNDVLRIRGGKTVEVLNTDAEGRLVMADGLVAASEEHPDAIIDVATLTGAQITALGNRYSGAMGDGGLVARTQAAAKAAGELVWHMPLPEELRPLLNSEIADIANVKPGNTAGGMLIAGHFLKEFVGKRDGADEQIPWVHLDIAGPANNGGAGYGFTGPGATGVLVRTLVSLLESYAV